MIARRTAVSRLRGVFMVGWSCLDAVCVLISRKLDDEAENRVAELANAGALFAQLRLASAKNVTLQSFIVLRVTCISRVRLATFHNQ
jgi:hypothetical protein